MGSRSSKDMNSVFMCGECWPTLSAHVMTCYCLFRSDGESEGESEEESEEEESEDDYETRTAQASMCAKGCLSE